MSFSWLFLGGLVSTRARFRFTNREQHAVNWLCRSSIFQRTANYLLTVCLTPGGKPTSRRKILLQNIVGVLSGPQIVDYENTDTEPFRPFDVS
jgi:hypothetical protein